MPDLTSEALKPLVYWAIALLFIMVPMLTGGRPSQHHALEKTSIACFIQEDQGRFSSNKVQESRLLSEFLIVSLK